MIVTHVILPTKTTAHRSLLSVVVGVLLDSEVAGKIKQLKHNT